jgi:hypothetical protein
VEVLHLNLGDQIGSNQPGVSDLVQERFQLVLFLSFADDFFWSPRNFTGHQNLNTHLSVAYSWREVKASIDRLQKQWFFNELLA